MRTMYDSTNPNDIPATAQMVAGYIDGEFAWPADGWDRFPAQGCVTIATQPGTNAGDVLDCETGDATPADCPGWIRMRKDAGLATPTIYCSRSAMVAVAQACGGLIYDLWVADWTGEPHEVLGAAATQYASPGTGANGHYDVSAVYDDAWPQRTAIVPATGGTDPMSLDIARSLVWELRLMLFGPAALSEPNAQAAIDSYAGQMAAGANPEAVLNSLFVAAQSDPRLLPQYKVAA